VVTVADDGGSSGRLRTAFGIPAPGDIRKCLVALAEDESLWARAFEHRFDAGELDGHALGNVILAGLTAVTGDFESALRAAAEVVRATGTVLPATVSPVVLKAESETGAIEGQVAVERAGRISGVCQVPADANPPPAVIEAIERAEQIVIGPGSLFTSVIAAVLPDQTRAAITHAKATTVYVCNLRTNPETVGFDVAAHVEALRAHGVTPDVVLCDTSEIAVGETDTRVVSRDLATGAREGHDAERLAAALADLVG
jgi:uncharacterized cofD-like protein